MNLRHRLDRIEIAFPPRSLREWSEEELHAALLPLLQRALIDPDLPGTVRSDIVADIGYLEGIGTSDDARSSRIRDWLRDC